MTPARAAKEERKGLMRQVPIGGVFLTVSPGIMTLYVRLSVTRVGCLVNSVGELMPTDIADNSTLIARDWFSVDVKVVLLSEQEQTRRIMLAHHGQGLRAIEPLQETPGAA